MERDDLRPIARVFYEDSREGGRFAFHESFILAAVGDSLVGEARCPDRWRLLKLLPFVTCNGASKILGKLTPQFAPRGEKLMVVLDADRASESLRCEDTDNSIAGAVKKGAADQFVAASATIAVLRCRLGDNLEGVIRLIREVQPELVVPATWDDALKKKKLAREDIFARVAADSFREPRRQILRDVPALSLVVQTLAEAVEAAVGLAPAN